MKWVNKINEINPNGKIIIHGLSMGGGIVLHLSDKEMLNVKCLIADAPSPSIESFFKNVSKEVFKKNYIKISKYMFEKFEKMFKVDALDFDGIKTVSNGKYPLLLAVGSNENLDELFNVIQNNNPKQTQTIILPGCNHGNGMYKQTDMFQSCIKEFVFKHIK